MGKQSKKPAKSEFHKLRIRVGLARHDEAEKFFQVCKKTIRNWDKKGAPATAMRLLQYWDKWDCAAHGPEWNGFKFSRGRLVNKKAGLIFTPNRLKLWPRLCDQLTRLETETATRRECPFMTTIRKMIRLARKTTTGAHNGRQR